MKTLDLKALELEPEEELYRFIRCMSERSGLCIHQEPFYHWISARPAINPNVVFRLGFEREGVETGIREAIECVDRGEIPPAWILGPLTRPADLARHLEENGFESLVQWSGMALDLDKLEAEPTPEGIEIRPLETDETLRDWTAVVTLNLFGGKPEHVDAQTELYRKVLGNERVRFYGALERGEVVATSILFLDGETAGIHCVSTDFDRRKRGIGRAVTLAPLLEAKQRGARVGILQASPLGEPVYRRMGFEEVCRMAIYRYRGVTP